MYAHDSLPTKSSKSGTQTSNPPTTQSSTYQERIRTHEEKYFVWLFHVLNGRPCADRRFYGITRKSTGHSHKLRMQVELRRMERRIHLRRTVTEKPRRSRAWAFLMAKEPARVCGVPSGGVLVCVVCVPTAGGVGSYQQASDGDSASLQLRAPAVFIVSSDLT